MSIRWEAREKLFVFSHGAKDNRVSGAAILDRATFQLNLTPKAQQVNIAAILNRTTF